MWNFLILLKGRAHWVFHKGYMHVRIFLPKDIRNPLPGLCSDIPQEKTPPFLLVAQQTTCRRFLDIKVLWKLRAS